MTKKEKILDYDEAKKAIFNLASTRKEYIKRWRNGELPNGLPSNPTRTYSDEEYGCKWEGWPKFLQTEWLSYEDAQEAIFELAKNKKGYLKLIELGILPKGLPRHPDRMYRKIWESWDEFLQVNNLQKSKNEGDEEKENATYEIAMYFCKNFKHSGSREVLASIKENYVLTKVAKDVVKEFFAKKKTSLNRND